MRSAILSMPKDARALRSREALRQALLRLLERVSYEQITVREITTEANVSAPVFYRQFATKDDLLNDIAADEIRSLLQLALPFDRSLQAEKLARMQCDYVDKNKALWRTLLTTGASAVMREEFVAIAHNLHSPDERIQPGFPAELLASLAVGALFEVLAWWLRQSDAVPFETAVTLVATLVNRPASAPYVINSAAAS